MRPTPRSPWCDIVAAKRVELYDSLKKHLVVEKLSEVVPHERVLPTKSHWLSRLRTLLFLQRWKRSRICARQLVLGGICGASRLQRNVGPGSLIAAACTVKLIKDRLNKAKLSEMINGLPWYPREHRSIADTHAVCVLLCSIVAYTGVHCTLHQALGQRE